MWAAKEMKKGKKVRRSNYGERVSIEIKGNWIYYSQGTKDIFKTDLKDIEATDWEIYEKVVWNLAVERKKVLTNEFRIYDECILSIRLDHFKTFIQKVKEDVKKIWTDKIDYEEFNQVIDKRAGKL